MFKLISNKIRCKWCGATIQSRSRHDFQQCVCKKCFTDGGLDYIRRGFEGDKPEDVYEDLSQYVEVETGRVVNAKDMRQEDIPVANPGDEDDAPVEVEKVPVVIPKEDGTHEIKEVDAIPVMDISEVIEEEAEPEKDVPYEPVIKEKNGWAYETTLNDDVPKNKKTSKPAWKKDQ